MLEQSAAPVRRIAFIVTQTEFGGAQRYVADLIRTLNRDAFSAVVITGPGAGTQLRTALGNTPVHVAQHLRRAILPHHDLAAIGELAKLLKSLNVDVVHLNSSKAGVLGAYAAHRAKVPRVVYTAHGFVFNEPMHPTRRLIYRLAERWSARHKDIIICVSDFDRKTALANRIAPSEKLRVVHNGIDLAALDFLDRASARSRLASAGIMGNGPLLGTIANFYPTKGLAYLIEAAAELHKTLPNLQVVLMGDGMERETLQRLIRHHQLSGVVHLPGQLPDARRLLPALDAFVCTSVKEGFPYTILEAMAAGLPIIATRVGGIPEMIEHEVHGLLIPPKHVLAAAAAIRRVLDDSALATRLGSAARARVASEFSLQRMATATIACYTE